MKVSIGIPAYKPEFLSEAIASVLAQTYADWELIVVDDCSPADIAGIVGKFSDPRIRYYRNEQNLGAADPSYNWDRCVSYARGEYFCLLCDDDLYHPTFLEEMLKLTEQFPECHVFRARAQVIDGRGHFLERFPSSPLWENCDDYIWHKTQNMRFQTISEWMLQAEHIQKCGGYVHFPCAWASDVESIYQFCVQDGIVSSHKTLVSFRNSGLNISMSHDKNLLSKLHALVLEKEMTTELIKRHSMDVHLIDLVEKKQKQESCYLLSFAGVRQFVEIAVFGRKRYCLDIKSIFKVLIKRILRMNRIQQP